MESHFSKLKEKKRKGKGVAKRGPTSNKWVPTHRRNTY